MKVRSLLAVMSLVFAAGIVDSLVLIIAVFAAIMNNTGTHPALSARILLLAFVLLVVLAVMAVVDEHGKRRRVR